MTNNQQVLVQLLSDAIRGRSSAISQNINLNWKEIFEQSISHSVFSLIYPSVRQFDINCKPDPKLMLTWQKSAIASGVHQVQHINEITRVLRQLSKEGISVLLLKGLVLRSLYPHPEQRTMSDADILIYEKDLPRTRILLLKLGYYEDNSHQDEKHIHFKHPTYLSIEVHWTLSVHLSKKVNNKMDHSIWDRSIAFNFYDIPAYSLSLEDQLLHLCRHKADHFLGCGFGLRQLCDLVLFVDANCECIDWNLFFRSVQDLGIFRFAIAIFKVCNQLFNMKLPPSFPISDYDDHEHINLLIEYILAGGTYGTSSSDQRIGNTLLRQFTGNGPEHYNPPGKFSKYFALIFPPRKILGEKYTYAKNHAILAPIAWIHRLFFYLLRKDSSWEDKIAFLSSSESTNIYYDRVRLLHWLDIEF